MLSGKASKRKAIKMQGPLARPDVEFGSCKHHSLTSHPGSFYSTSGSIIFHDRSPSSFFWFYGVSCSGVTVNRSFVVLDCYDGAARAF